MRIESCLCLGLIAVVATVALQANAQQCTTVDGVTTCLPAETIYHLPAQELFPTIEAPTRVEEAQAEELPAANLEPISLTPPPRVGARDYDGAIIVSVDSITPTGVVRRTCPPLHVRAPRVAFRRVFVSTSRTYYAPRVTQRRQVFAPQRRIWFPRLRRLFIRFR